MVDITSLIPIVLLFVAGFIVGALLTFFLLDRANDYRPKIKETKQKNIEENNLNNRFIDNGYTISDEVYSELTSEDKETMIHNNRKKQTNAYDYAANKDR